jgi:hypothetical protein
MIEDKRENLKVSCLETSDASKAYWKNKRKTDCDAVYTILKESNKEIGTGELCELLNKKMGGAKYDSTSFMTALGKKLREDDRIVSFMGHVKGRRTTIYKLKD